MRLIRWTFTLQLLFTISCLKAEDRPEVSSPEPASTPVVLQYKFAEGDQWHYTLSEKGIQTAISEAVTQTATNNSAQHKHYQIVQVNNDGSAIIEVIYDRIRIDFTAKVGDNAANKLVYDTDAGGPPPKGLEGIKKSIGKAFARFRLSPSGEMTELEFPQENQQPNPQGNQQLNQAAQRKGMPIAFPAKPIQIGESWSEKLNVNLGRKLQQQYTVQTIYQLKNVEDGIAEISSSTIIQPRLTDPVLRGQMMQYLPQGTIRFDLAQGRIVSRTETVDRRELGVGGPKTVMIIDNRKQETLIDPQRQGLAD